MSDKPQSRGGGIFIVLGIGIGTAIGTALHQPSLGIVGGAAVGIAIAFAVWGQDRNRTGE